MKRERERVTANGASKNAFSHSSCPFNERKRERERERERISLSSPSCLFPHQSKSELGTGRGLFFLPRHQKLSFPSFLKNAATFKTNLKKSWKVVDSAKIDGAKKQIVNKLAAAVAVVVVAVVLLFVEANFVFATVLRVLVCHHPIEKSLHQNLSLQGCDNPGLANRHPGYCSTWKLLRLDRWVAFPKLSRDFRILKLSSARIFFAQMTEIFFAEILSRA